MPNFQFLKNVIPVGPLKLIGLPGSEILTEKVHNSIIEYRERLCKEFPEKEHIPGYICNNYMVECDLPRFGTGESKGELKSSIRGADVFIIADMVNPTTTYSAFGHTNHLSPDDHYQNLKRVIAAIAGKAHRINVIMPYLYEGRQHRRTSRESLDCALALEELVNMGVRNIITFDAHDPRVMNAIPLAGFDNYFPSYQFLKALLKSYPDIQFDKGSLMVISPDEGAMSRAVYFANVLGMEMGMFYKRRDYSIVENGKNPIVAHEFIGDSVEGKDCIVIDDMISSGGSMLDVASQLKARGASHVYAFATFGLFTDGFDQFDQYYRSGILTKVITTDLIYQSPELLSREWYEPARMSRYIASIIDTMNHDISIDKVRNNTLKINKLLKKHRKKARKHSD